MGFSAKVFRKAAAMISVLAMLLMLIPAIGVVSTSAAEERVAYVDFSNPIDGKPEMVGITKADFGGYNVQQVGLVYLEEYGWVGRNLDFLRIAIDNNVIPSTERNLVISVTYLDVFAQPDEFGLPEELQVQIPEEGQKFYLQYITENNTYTNAGDIYLTNTGQFLTESFATTAAVMDKSQDGYDMRINCIGLGRQYPNDSRYGDLAGQWMNFSLYIKRVEIRVAPDISQIEPPEFPEMTALNNMKGKSIVGYQMWFVATSGETGWVHWNGNTRPKAGNITVEQWPEVSEYPESVLYPTDFPPLPDGTPAKLFTSVKDETVELHLQWMQKYGIDGFAVQRFYGTTSPIRQPGRTNLDMAKDYAEKYGRGFYVMYDLNGAQSAGMGAVDRLKADWIYNVEGRGLISSPNYLQMNGKPVVCMWGMDANSTSYATKPAVLAMIDWFQNRGYYVIGGVPNNDWAVPGKMENDPFDEVYQKLDMISPWTVGRYRTLSDVANWVNNKVTQHLAYCQKYGIDYQPVIFAGSAWSNFNWGPANDIPRLAGKFLWEQARRLKEKGVDNVYFAMFDEYDEGTALMKGARDSYDVPNDEFQYFLTYAADGQWMSSDYYLRLAGVITKMMRGEVEPTQDIPIPLSEGPIYFRNGFEYRLMMVKEADTKKPLYAQYAPLDPSIVGASRNFDQDPVIENGIPGGRLTDDGEAFNDISLTCYEELYDVRTGLWYAQLKGTSAGKAKVSVVMNDTNIKVPENLTLRFSIRPRDELGRYAYIDLLFDDGTRLSDLQGGLKGQKGKVGEWQDIVITLDNSLKDKVITNILACYDSGPVSNDTFTADFDDVIIEVPQLDKTFLQKLTDSADALMEQAGQYGESANAVKSAVAAAKSVLGKENPTEQEINNAIVALHNAVKALTLSTVKGDVDGNGVVNTTDARMALQAAVKKITLTSSQEAAADVDGKPGITATDARLILQFVVKKIPSL